MRRGCPDERHRGAVWHQRQPLSLRLPVITERPARQGQAAAARSGRPRGGPSTKVLGIAVSDKETSIRQDLSLGTFVLSLRNRLCARGLFVSLTAIPRQRRGPPRGRPDRPARGRACRAAVMQRGCPGERHRGAVWRQRQPLSLGLPGITERLARQGQVAAARSGRPRGGPSTSVLGIAVSDKETGTQQSESLRHRHPPPRPRLPVITERPARQGQAAAARSGRPRGGPRQRRGIAASDKL